MNKKYSGAELDDVFDALANEKRRLMINTLAYRPATVSQLAKESKLSLPAIHKHIRILEKAGLIERRKVGRTNFVALKKRSLNSVQGWLKQFRAEWGNDKETLDNYIAGMND